MRRKIRYEFQTTWDKKESEKLQNKEFQNHIKEALLQVLLEQQKISRWQYEESLKQLRKGG